MIASQNKIQSFIERHKSGNASGITSVCSANWYVIKAAILNAKENNSSLLVEATSNQVNQFGGYTGYTPRSFRDKTLKCAVEMDFPPENVILGGDHLGPNTWQKENSETAMNFAGQQVAAYTSAGFTKIHLDTCFKCADDGEPGKPLHPSVIAERAALLCKASEDAYGEFSQENDPPVYIIGTDVPPPGGSKDNHSSLRITPAEEVEETIELTRKAFYKNNLQEAWNRVIAVVVQPGVEFGDTVVVNYLRDKALKLIEKIESYDNLIYEAHSTDYQTKEALRQMVIDHFAILKVGPWLTYSFREAVFALAYIEKELFSSKRNVKLSGIIDILEARMLQNPVYWKDYYSGDDDDLRFARKYSYSDRIRYYWSDELIAASLGRLMENLNSTELPLTLLSQFLPNEYEDVREGKISRNLEALILHKINKVLQFYNYAVNGAEN